MPCRDRVIDACLYQTFEEWHVRACVLVPLLFFIEVPHVVKKNNLSPFEVSNPFFCFSCENILIWNEINWNIAGEHLLQCPQMRPKRGKIVIALSALVAHYHQTGVI